MYDEAQLAQLNVESAAPEERPPECSFLCGRAGTGKTTLIQTQVGRDPSYGMIGATTGIAAVNIGSTTINSLLGYFDTQSMRDEHMEGNLVRKLHKIAKDHQRLIIEEVSMMDGEQLDMLYRATCAANLYKAMPRLDLMVVGDFAQLPPVKAKWAFEANCWPHFGANITRLEKVWRQSEVRFIEALNLARAGSGGPAVDILDTLGVQWHSQRDLDYVGTTIVPKNDMVNRHNQTVLDLLPGKSQSIPSRRWGQQRREWGFNERTHEWGIPPAVELKRGAYVMILANRRSEDEFIYVNGDCGTVVDINPVTKCAAVRLVRTGEVVTVDPVVRSVRSYDSAPDDAPSLSDDDPNWYPAPHTRKNKYWVGQLEYTPLRLAYATTIHKSQGLSLDRIQVDFRDRFFANPAFLYVALSRVKTFPGLRLVGDRDRFISTCKSEWKVRDWL